MQVKDLVAILNKMDPNSKVIYWDDGGDPHSADMVFGFEPEEIIVEPGKDQDFEHIRNVKVGDKLCIFAPQF